MYTQFVFFFTFFVLTLCMEYIHWGILFRSLIICYHYLWKWNSLRFTSSRQTVHGLKYCGLQNHQCEYRTSTLVIMKIFLFSFSYSTWNVKTSHSVKTIYYVKWCGIWYCGRHCQTFMWVMVRRNVTENRVFP